MISSFKTVLIGLIKGRFNVLIVLSDLIRVLIHGIKKTIIPLFSHSFSDMLKSVFKNKNINYIRPGRFFQTVLTRPENYFKLSYLECPDKNRAFCLTFCRIDAIDLASMCKI